MADALPTILVIEDEAPIRRVLRIALESNGFTMTEADRGRRGIELAATLAPDAVVLDLGLPDMDGKEVVTAIRDWSVVPVLVLSVRSGVQEKIDALDAGANDYVTKPFAPGELLARLRVLLRDRPATEQSAPAYSTGSFSLDYRQRRVTVAGAEVKLTRKEYDVLALLTRHAGRLVTHKQLLSAVWGPAHLEDTHYLRIAVARLREKLNDSAAAPRLIQTDPGVGYRLLEGRYG